MHQPASGDSSDFNINFRFMHEAQSIQAASAHKQHEHSRNLPLR